MRLQTTIGATLSYLHRGERPFRVTAKPGTSERHRDEAPWLLWLLLAPTALTLAWFTLSVASHGSAA
ncbi:MAG TPA: hypothetical protein VMV53_02485 [Acidimicrobiales bacterium]|nr:hypothetical protein [Acidimicrobiales bacterium]